MEEAAGIKTLDRRIQTHVTTLPPRAVGRSRCGGDQPAAFAGAIQTVQDMVMDGKIDMGRARSLLASGQIAPKWSWRIRSRPRIYRCARPSGW